MKKNADCHLDAINTCRIDILPSIIPLIKNCQSNQNFIGKASDS